MQRFWLTLVFMFAPAFALAQTATSTAVVDIKDADAAIGALQLLVQAFKSGSWALFAGLLLALLVAAARYLKVLDLIKIPDSWDKYVAMALSTLTSISVGLVSHQPWYTIIQTAVTVAVAAIGGWEMLLRPIRDKVLKKAKIGE